MTCSIFTPISGKNFCSYRQFQFFKTIKDHPLIKEIILINTTNDKLMVEDLNYREIHFPTKTSKYMGRARTKERIDHKNEIHSTLASIYNLIFLHVTTPFVWIIEDDNIPNENHLDIFYKNYDENYIGICSPYFYAGGKNYNIWTNSKQENPLLTEIEDYMIVEGGGFGSCFLNVKKMKKFSYNHEMANQHAIWGLDVQYFYENGPVLTSKFLICKHLREDLII